MEPFLLGTLFILLLGILLILISVIILATHSKLMDLKASTMMYFSPEKEEEYKQMSQKARNLLSKGRSEQQVLRYLKDEGYSRKEAVHILQGAYMKKKP
jgi:uncharacterized metal-binding protein